VPDALEAAFRKLPKIMAKADALAGQIERAAVDLAETVVLQPLTGERFEAVVTDIDERGARIQLCGEPVVARVKTDGLAPGERIEVRLEVADPATRQLKFSALRTIGEDRASG
jgi:exoribonuclease R